MIEKWHSEGPESFKEEALAYLYPLKEQLYDSRVQKFRKFFGSIINVKGDAYERFMESLVPVKGGTFTMGCNRDQRPGFREPKKPAHQVTVSDFHIGKYEVTQKEWRDVMEHASGIVNSEGKSTDKPMYTDDYPIVEVSWYDAVVFCNKLSKAHGFIPCYYEDAGFTKIYGFEDDEASPSEDVVIQKEVDEYDEEYIYDEVFWNESANGYRLPTEAEWEYAARGGSLSQGYEYAGSDFLDEVGWNGDNSGYKVHPVGQKKANELGLYDMSGNVNEWCWDWSSRYPSSAVTDPIGPSSGESRIIRGGDIIGDPEFCQVTSRCGWTPNNRDGIGFRLVRSLSRPVRVVEEIQPASALPQSDSSSREAAAQKSKRRSKVLFWLGAILFFWIGGASGVFIWLVGAFFVWIIRLMLR